jgi:hypothetical protein
MILALQTLRSFFADEYRCSLLEGLYEKNVTEFKTLKIAFGLSFFNLCVSRLLVQTTRFVVKYLQKPLTCKAET